MEDFEYILQKQELQKICFGSGCPRDTSRKGMNPFMRYYTSEEYPRIAPGAYNVLKSFKTITTKPCSHSISKKGFSGIARFGKRVVPSEDTPSPFSYNVNRFPKPVSQSKYPFTSTSKRKTFAVNENPGPGMYVSTGKRGIQFEHSFGGRIKTKLGVDLKCCSSNTDTCRICGNRPLGDYWHRNNKIFLCRSCMEQEFQKETKYKRRELKLFRKIRDCSNIHLHEGTDAKVWLMHPSAVTQWARKEAYLMAYLKD